MFLLDTSIVSRLDPRRHRQAGVSDLVGWLRRNGARLFISVITLTEIEAGILSLRRRGQDRCAAEYGVLRCALETDFGDRILPVDPAAALMIARLAEAARPAVIEWKDLIIAATAAVHDLTVLTTNMRHFELAGVPALDPLVRLPPDIVQ